MIRILFSLLILTVQEPLSLPDKLRQEAESRYVSEYVAGLLREAADRIDHLEKIQDKVRAALDEDTTPHPPSPAALSLLVQTWATTVSGNPSQKVKEAAALAEAFSKVVPSKYPTKTEFSTATRDIYLPALGGKESPRYAAWYPVLQKIVEEMGDLPTVKEYDQLYKDVAAGFRLVTK